MDKEEGFFLSREQYQTVIKTLHDCMETCNHCYDDCLKEEDIHMMSDCIRLDRECAVIRGYLEQALGRGTPFASELVGVCAQICEACGMNVRSTIMIIVRDVPKLALHVQKSVEKTPGNWKLKILGLWIFLE